ncbi:MAG TPA: two-component system response regulator CreB [Pseudomonadota bacterium]|jgi:two-component system catabolic regulation response regulator CreB|nr:two-component system response regulator CreB [Pseudomonadota bacterium]
MTRILLVEDEGAIAQTIEFALRAEGFETAHALNGRDALRIVADDAFDLVLLDVGLPDIDGYALLRELRRSRDLPAIFLTARHAEAERVLGLELGADDYVAKPFSPRELVARVRAVLRRGRAQQSLAGFEHDAEGRRVFFRGRQLDLTRYEYGLLAALLQRPGAILTRAQLMDRVWSDDRDSSDRTVDTHVKTLRAKLRDIDAGADPIRTQRGLGYSLQVD